jgi:hypothetical protein
MALNSYSGLKDAALAWIERTGDPAATSIVDDCVTLCEARVNKTPTLRLSMMETEATVTLAGGTGALPSDFLAMHRVVANYSVPRVLSYAEPGWYHDAYPINTTDEEGGVYTIVGPVLHARASTTLGIVYYAKVPPLATNDPNWLLQKAPDVYLYGTILEMLNALEGNGVEKYGGMFGAAVQGLIASETFSRGGVLTMRASMPAP